MQGGPVRPGAGTPTRQHAALPKNRARSAQYQNLCRSSLPVRRRPTTEPNGRARRPAPCGLSAGSAAGSLFDRHPKRFVMAYLAPSEFVTKMVDAGEAKVFMSTRDTLIRAYMAGAILSLAAAFAVTVTVQTGSPLVGAILFPVGFCLLLLLGYDLLTGVFVLTPLALLDRRPGVTPGGVLRNWG